MIVKQNISMLEFKLVDLKSVIAQECQAARLAND